MFIVGGNNSPKIHQTPRPVRRKIKFIFVCWFCKMSSVKNVFPIIVFSFLVQKLFLFILQMYYYSEIKTCRHHINYYCLCAEHRCRTIVHLYRIIIFYAFHRIFCMPTGNNCQTTFRTLQ
jgi:hypothetical protein